MRMVRKVGWTALLVVTIAGTANAADVALSEFRVTLESLYLEAQSQSPALLAAQAKSRRSEALKDAATGRLLPQLSFQSSLSRTYYRNDLNSAAYDGKRAGLTLSQALYDPAVSAGVDRSQQLVEQTRSETVAARHRTANALVERYFAVIAAEERAELLAEQVYVTETNLEQVK